MKLIDKEKVIAEIERRIANHNKELERASDEDFVSSWASDEENQKIALIALIPFLDTLETKEVDLEKEIYDYFNEWQNVLCDEDCCNEGGFCCVLDENVKPVNIERCRKVAKHFFKLGINSK